MGWNVTRRNFLYSMAVLSSIFTAGFGNIGTLLKKPSGKRSPLKKKNRSIRNGKSLVSVVGGLDVEKAVAEAVSLIEGFEALDAKGRKVLVKPNVVAGRKNPTTTNPNVVRAVVKLLYGAGASEVWVGDMSALFRSSTKKNMEDTGIRRAAEEAGAKVVYFDEHEWYEVSLTGGKYIKSVAVSEWLYRTERIVNLPVIKTHRSASYSLCLKNFVGATHFKERPYFVDRSHWEEVIAEINLAYTPDINIVDGTTSMIEGGPWSGKEARTNLIMASGDRVAADAVGLGIIKAFGVWPAVTGKSVWEQRQIRRAVELGMGARSADEIELLTASLDGNEDFERLMEKARGNIVFRPAP